MQIMQTPRGWDLLDCKPINPVTGEHSFETASDVMGSRRVDLLCRKGQMTCKCRFDPAARLKLTGFRDERYSNMRQFEVAAYDFGARMEERFDRPKAGGARTPLPVIDIGTGLLVAVR